MLLRAIGYSSDQDIYSVFNLTKEYNLKKDKKDIIGKSTIEDIVSSKTGEIIVEKGVKISESKVKDFVKNNINSIILLANEDSLKTQILKNTF